MVFTFHTPFRYREKQTMLTRSTILFLLTSSLNTSGLVAQDCTESVPAIATLIDTDGTFNGQGTFFWVCGDTEVTFSNTFGIVYVEADCDIVINSAGGGIYYVKSGGTVTINSPGVQLQHGPGTVVINNVGSGSVTSCTSMTFDYANAPMPGCDISTAVRGFQATNPKPFPNPTNDLIQIPAIDGITSVRLLDGRGRMLRTVPAPFRNLSVVDLPSGRYILQVRNGENTTHHSIVIE